MIKGIVALFTSGKFFEPMVLLGVLSGLLVAAFLPSFNDFFSLYATIFPYLGAFLVALVYVWGFRRVYTSGSAKVDVKATFGVVFARFFDFIIANVMMILFAMFLFF